MAALDLSQLAQAGISGGAAGAPLGPVGAVAGAGIGIASGLIGWLIESGYEEEANEILRKAQEEYGQVNDEAVKAAASKVLGPTNLSQIQRDPRYRAMQDDALAQMASLSRSGLSMTDRANLSDAMEAAGAEARAAQDHVLQSARSRGMAGSGAELAAALQAGQSGANRASQTAGRIAGDASDRALRALSETGRMAGGLEATDYGRAERAASAQDAIDRFNNAEGYNRAADQYTRDLSRAATQYGFAQERAGQHRAAGQRAGNMVRGIGRQASNAAQGVARSTNDFAGQDGSHEERLAESGVNLGNGVTVTDEE
jgi:hypothetical protein